MDKHVKTGIGVLIEDKDSNKILLGHRVVSAKDTGGIYEPDSWTLPGGKQEYDETTIETGIREVKEETNLDVSDLELYFVSDDIAIDRHYVTIDYITNNFVGDIKIMEPTKIDEWKWFSIEELPENIYSPSKKCIEYYLENKRRNED